MNCLEFRRQVDTAPGSLDAAARAHARECEACAGLHRRAVQFDRALREAAHVAPPENLEARILMRQSFQEPRRRRGVRRAWPALAAALVLVLAATLYGVRVVHEEAGLHTELVALVNAADYALQARGPVPADAIGDALRPAGLDLSDAPGNVSFAGRCLVRGNLSGHLVLRESAAPVSVFLMPRERVMRTSSFRGERWHGVVAPAGNGAVGIVLPRGDALDPALLERLVRSVRWPA